MSGIPKTPQKAPAGFVVASSELRQEVSKLVRELGLPAASRKLKVCRQTLSTVMAGLPVRRGTLSALREALSANVLLTASAAHWKE